MSEPTASAPAVQPAALPGFVERLADLPNPILVKEVRQALRGRMFRMTFGLTLLVSLTVAVIIVLAGAADGTSSPVGPDFYRGIGTCLAAAVLVFVPMGAFTAMGAEWEENTFDLLVLSRMRPRHIVGGKLLAAGVQALLYFSAFCPFLVFTFLLGGMDLGQVVVTLPVLAVESLALSALGLALSSVTHQRMVRVFLMVLLTAACVLALGATMGFAEVLLEQGLDLASDEAQMLLTGITVVASVLCGLSFATATSRLAHEEENHSTALRALTTVLLVLCLGWAVWLRNLMGQDEAFYVVAVFTTIGLGLLSLFFITERETLGRRVAAYLPRSRAVRLLVLPWLPGGGRGAVFLLLHAALVLVWALAFVDPWASISARPEAAAIFVTALAYVVIYLCIPAALVRVRATAPRRLALARLLVPVVFLLGMLLPTLFGFLTGNEDLARGRHVGNPFRVFDEVFGAGTNYAFLPGVALLAGIAVLLQVPRIVGSVVEVLRVPVRGERAPDEVDG